MRVTAPTLTSRSYAGEADLARMHANLTWNVRWGARSLHLEALPQSRKRRSQRSSSSGIGRPKGDFQ